MAEQPKSRLGPWARSEQELLGEVYRMLGKNESEIVRLTREMEALLRLLERGNGLFKEEAPKQN